MKTVVLVHGWGGSPKKDWFEWADVEIKKLGYNVVCPEMPETDEPKISLWVDKLNEILKKTEGEIILIGHSIGCQTILRTLAGGDIKSTINKIILVAPWWFLTVGEEEDIIAKPWYDQNIDFNKIKKNYKDILCFFSDNDPVVPLDLNLSFLKNKLNPKVVIKSNMGHFSGDDNPPVINLPFILDYLK